MPSHFFIAFASRHDSYIIRAVKMVYSYIIRNIQYIKLYIPFGILYGTGILYMAYQKIYSA